MSNYKDLTGMRFGKLTVLGRAGSRCSFSLWHCRCDCGKECDVISVNLTRGNSKSCGCENRKKVAQSKRKFYTKDEHAIARVYYGMMNRCYNPNDKTFAFYGARGISVSPVWYKRPEAFVRWSKLHGWDPSLTIDRIDVEGDYSPSNCRWADSVTQANNKRNNHWITVNGETKTIAQWARTIGVNVHTLTNHCLGIKGFSPAEEYISRKLSEMK